MIVEIIGGSMDGGLLEVPDTARFVLVLHDPPQFYRRDINTSRIRGEMMVTTPPQPQEGAVLRKRKIPIQHRGDGSAFIKIL